MLVTIFSLQKKFAHLLHSGASGGDLLTDCRSLWIPGRQQVPAGGGMPAPDGPDSSTHVFHRLMPETRHQMIVHHARGLHMGIDDGGPRKLEPPLLQVSGKRVRFL